MCMYDIMSTTNGLSDFILRFKQTTSKYLYLSQVMPNCSLLTWSQDLFNSAKQNFVLKESRWKHTMTRAIVSSSKV